MKSQNFFQSCNSILEKFMPFLTPLGVIAGFLLGTTVAWMKPAIPYLFAFITLISTLEMNLSSFGKELHHPLTFIAIFTLSHVVFPAIMFLITSVILGFAPEVVTGYILLASIPTAITGNVWTSIFHGNSALSLIMILIDTLLSPLVIPATVHQFMGSSVEVNTVDMIVSLIIMVVLPLLIGILAKRNIKNKEFISSVTLFCKPFTKIALCIVVMINVAQISGKIIWQWTLVPIVFSNIGGTIVAFMLGYIGARLMHKDDSSGVAMMYATGMRNISVALVLAIDFFPPATALPVIVGITIQQSLAAFAGKILIRKVSRGKVVMISSHVSDLGEVKK